MTTIDSAGVGRIIATAQEATKPHLVEAGSHYVVHLPGGGFKHLDLTTDEYRDYPRHKTGTVVVEDVAAFTQYYGKHADDGSEVFASLDNGSVTAVLDAHKRESDGGPRWQQHRLVLQLRQTEPWKAWMALNKQMVPQQRFAEHIEENASDIRSSPTCDVSAADMMLVAQEFHAHTKAAYASGTRLSSGEVQFMFTEELTASAGGRNGAGTIKIPSVFEVVLAPFDDVEPRPVKARFRYRINPQEKTLTLGYVLERPEDVLRDAVRLVVAKVEALAKVTAMRGAPAR